MKSILITGASSGIGQALAWEMAERENQVFIVGRRLEKLQQTAQRFPEKIEMFQADVGISADREKIISALQGKKLDYVVHNAGTADPVAMLSDLKLEDFRKAIATNLEGPVFLTQALLPQLKSGGRILNISTGLAHRALKGTLAYCTSKAALHMAYLAFNLELNPKEIYTGSVMPGVVDTEMQAHLRIQNESNLPDVEMFRGFKEQHTLRSAESVARLLALFLENTSNETFTEKDWAIDELDEMFKAKE